MSLKGVVMSSTEVNTDEVSSLAESIIDTCSVFKPDPEVAVTALLTAANFISEMSGISDVIVYSEESSIQLLVTKKNDSSSETVAISSIH